MSPDTDSGVDQHYLHRGRQWAAELMRDRLRPPPDLTVSEWADHHRILPDYSAEPGPWRTSRTPYLREIMDAFSDPMVEQVVFQAAAQVGKSEVLLNVLGYFIDLDPCPILLVQENDDAAEDFSKERIAPSIQNCPVLASKVVEPKSRDAGNTIAAKEFTGGHLAISGATTPGKLARRPRRVVLFDEVDKYPPSAGVEGDPVELGMKRTNTFWNRKIGLVSTPTLSGLSRIEEAYEQSDQRRYYVPCPDCGHEQTLEWPQLLDGTQEDENGALDPKTAAYPCQGCGVLIEERHKPWMLRQGAWVSQSDSEKAVGFRLSALYSPWVRWEELVSKFLEVKDNPERLKTFVNQQLAETWEERGQQLQTDPLLNRREEYSADPLPEGVTLITAGVDVQADRLECEVVGWGPGEESWALEYFRIPGDPSVGDVWGDLDQVLGKRYRHPSGVRLAIAATCVDSGYLTQQVYKYCGDRQNARVWAIKGMDGMGRPIMDRPRRNTRGKVPLYPVGVDAAKVAIYQRLQIDAEPAGGGESVAEGYCHFPLRQPYDEEYFRQLTAEKLVRKQTRRGHQKLQWVRRPNRRAEALDIRVYAMAALEGLQAAGASLDPEQRRRKRKRRRVRSRGLDD